MLEITFCLTFYSLFSSREFKVVVWTTMNIHKTFKRMSQDRSLSKYGIGVQVLRLQILLVIWQSKSLWGFRKIQTTYHLISSRDWAIAGEGAAVKAIVALAWSLVYQTDLFLPPPVQIILTLKVIFVSFSPHLPPLPPPNLSPSHTHSCYHDRLSILVCVCVCTCCSRVHGIGKMQSWRGGAGWVGRWTEKRGCLN